MARGRRPIISPARCIVHYRVGIVRSVINANGEFSRYQEEVRRCAHRCTIRRSLRASLSTSLRESALSISPGPYSRGTPHRWPATTQDESLEMQRAVRSPGCACGR